MANSKKPMWSEGEPVNGASLESSPSNESIDLSVLQGQTVKDITEGNPCPVHGKRYWLFAKTGPCLHPTCVNSTLEYLDATTSQKEFRQAIRLGIVDLVSWGATEGFAYLADCWTNDPGAWSRLCKEYIKHRKLEYVRGPKMRAEVQDWLVNELNTRKDANHGTRQDYPDARVWLKQCATYLMDSFGPAVTAAVFGCVEITDVAKLCFKGDVTKARHACDEALEELRRWHVRRTSNS